MIKVSDLKRLGIEVAAEDKFLHGSDKRCVTGFQAKVINETNDLDDMLIIEFAWRENTGEKPDFDGLILLEMARGGSGYATSPGDLRWSLEADSSDIDYWKPCMKSLLAQVESGEPEQAEEVQLGIKHDQDKPRYDLLPAVAIDELAKVLTFGAKKYAPNSWQAVENGLERYRAALLRHTFAIQRGELIDEESGLQHSAHAMTCAAFIVELEKQLEQE